MWRGLVITCPLCRKEWDCSGDLNSLPTNMPVLHIMKLRNQQEKQSFSTNADYQVHIHTYFLLLHHFNSVCSRWCLTCVGGSKVDCVIENHSCIQANSLPNFDTLLSLKEHALELKKKCLITLANAIEKRKDIEKELVLDLELIKNVVTQIRQDNKTMMDEMASLLEQGLSSSQEEEHKDFLTDLVSLLDESSSQDTFETLKKKMGTKFHLTYDSYKNKFALAAAEMAEIESMFDPFRSLYIGVTSGVASQPTVKNPKLILSLFKSRIYVGEVVIQPILNRPFSSSSFSKQLGDLLSSDLFTITPEKVFLEFRGA